MDPGNQKCDRGGRFWTQRAKSVIGVADVGPEAKELNRTQQESTQLIEKSIAINRNRQKSAEIH